MSDDDWTTEWVSWVNSQRDDKAERPTVVELGSVDLEAEIRRTLDESMAGLRAAIVRYARPTFLRHPWRWWRWNRSGGGAQRLGALLENAGSGSHWNDLVRRSRSVDRFVWPEDHR